MTYPIYALALGGIVIYFVVTSANSYIAEWRFKKAHGCKPERKLPQWDGFMGIGLYRAQKRAFLESRVLEAVIGRYKLADRTTYSSRLLGLKFYNTIDPENIKAILATNFSDFGLGQRLKTFDALLGKGIFTSDGEAWEHSRVSIAQDPLPLRFEIRSQSDMRIGTR